ncbi:MAG: LysR family transcriptional regulator [Acidobacteriaceae bacterium]|nr:LysR family transcriptional regulator [Acidobacteriaceae bacterium]
MELRHLRYFRAVAQEQSFTLAARQLHVSQSGVSGQVRDLERELGVALFCRDQKQISLTPEGVFFLREAQEILERADHAAQMVRQPAQGRSGKLTIGLCGPATAFFLPRVIRDFRRRQPGIALSLKDLDPAQQPEALANGKIDIGFTREIPPKFRHALASEVLYCEPLLAALPRGHRLENTSVSISDLAQEQFVLYARENAPELFDGILSLCRRARFSPNIIDTPSLWQSVLTMVEAGEGVSILPACVQQLRSRDVSFEPLRNRKCMVDVIVAWRAGDADTIREGFLNLLRNHDIEKRQISKQR